MKAQYPDYSNSVMNVSCSVMKYFGVKDLTQDTLPELDSLIELRRPRNIAILLFDAMGTAILDRHIESTSFLQTHRLKTISSTFPPTTVAATTAVSSGYAPIETGWLGWVTYFKEVDQNVLTFFSTKQFTDGEQAAPYHLSYTHLPYRTIYERISEADSSVQCCAVSPFPLYGAPVTHKAETPKQICTAVEDICKEEGNHFIYAYCVQPDSSLHEYGVYDSRITPIIHDINDSLQALSESLGPDTLAIVIADHGHINSKWFYLCDYPELNSMLVRAHAMENRAASLFVKPGMEKDFARLFKEITGDHFILMSHDEFLQSGLLGSGTMHSHVPSMIGSFVAIATDEYCLGDTHDDSFLVGIHAGLTDEEMNVPLIIL